MILFAKVSTARPPPGAPRTGVRWVLCWWPVDPTRPPFHGLPIIESPDEGALILEAATRRMTADYRGAWIARVSDNAAADACARTDAVSTHFLRRPAACTCGATSIS